MTGMRLPGSRGLAAWLIAGMCVSVLAIIWFGYRAVREWQRSSVLLVERRAKEASDLLVTALTHDMRAVQKSVLTAVDRDALLDPAVELGKLVSSAFARYPYPDVFFAGQSVPAPERLTFFTRSDRPPVWAPADVQPSRFPVTVLTDANTGAAIAERLLADAAMGRRYTIFETSIAGVPHQVVARLLYRDHLSELPDGVFGFMVNLTWVRHYYFPEITSQVSRIAGTASGLALDVVDETGKYVVRTEQALPGGPSRRRTFPVIFFDPLLVAVDQPAKLGPDEWAVVVSGAGDPTLTSAIRGADRTLGLAALAAVSLAFGLAMTARAVRSNASLAELRSEFVATVTHELKTPIATIRAAGDTLVSGRISSPADQRGYAQLVVQEAKRLTLLVDNLLAMARITDATEVYSFEPIVIDGIVDATLHLFAPQLADGGFKTEVDLPADLPAVRGDRLALCLMLDNLVDNAIRYSASARYLRLAARREGDRVMLEVTDRGRGIPQDEIQHVTRKFFRGRRVPANGSGLGLAIVKRIVTDHGGTLSIRSTVDAGTTVSVHLPVYRDREEADTRG